jgi:5-oxoprolinase (ATP-hydrolysing)
VVDAYLDPILSAYLDGVAAHLKGGHLLVMSSAGGLVPRSDYRAKDSLLSGPAGGVVGAARVGLQAGYEKVLGFDMGGTSSDVCRFDGQYDYHFEHRVGRARVMAPVLNIETVAAGGGSICGFNGDQLFVGPQSAGASPGPACYGAGGPLTVTDVNLLLGRLDPQGLGIPVDIDAAKRALEKVRSEVETGYTETELLAGFLEIANERMADAVRKRSVAEGVDPSAYALVAFGGAGGQHACAIANKLGVSTVLCPQEAGLLSASGLRVAVLERFAEESVLRELKDIAEELPKRFEALSQQAMEKLQKEGLELENLGVRRRLISLRHLGQEACQDIDYGEKVSCVEAFRKAYETRFGYWPEHKSIEVVSLRVVASSEAPSMESERFSTGSVGADHGSVVHRRDLRSGMELQGPVLVQDDFCSVVIDKDWTGVVGSLGTIKLSQCLVTSGKAKLEIGDGGLIEEELFRCRFQAIVEDMGELLRRTAVSTNVKERMDYSCALLDRGGRLLTNAPHIPVHLGALGLCVRSIVSKFDLKQGDMIVTNHPGHGGSHLPDVTVISPIFDVDGTLMAFVANRAHHAEMGGICPGSMPPQARSLAEEGVVIAPMYLYRAGEANFAAVEELLLGQSWPSRAVRDNIADLKAQAAANLLGVRALLNLSELHGSHTVTLHMTHQFERAAAAIERRLIAFGSASHECSERLDDGTVIKASLNVLEGKVHIDFSGTARHHPGHFNATPAIVHSAVIYVLRILVNEPVALNEGLFERVELKLPHCFLNPHFPDDPNLAPPVVGGNVETSQRLVNLLLKPFAVVAASQGTMNNLIFGNENCSYYETIGGGCGAGPDFIGASAVHSHMTNTAITDPEILELRFPVRLENFGVRRGSGGQGLNRGGDGIVRQLLFKEAVSLSLLTQHRKCGPYGMSGGEDGSPGEQLLIKANGQRVPLGATVQESLDAGDRLLLNTPGGGGFGIAKPG